MTKEIAGNIFKRLLLEFVPSILVGLSWAYFNRASAVTMADSVTHFSAAFVLAAFVWSSILRIHYQQTTRAQQVELAGGVQGVDTQIKDIGTEISAVKTILATLTEKIDGMAPTLSDKDAIEITNLVRTANNHIDTANTAYETVRHYRMKADGGKIQITSGSE